LRGLSLILLPIWKPYLPRSILWRQKEQFSDGVGYSWIDGQVVYYLCIEFS
jgi:asparagine synthetase B (glutamine-hydrolysing)